MKSEKELRELIERVVSSAGIMAGIAFGATATGLMFS